MSRFKKGFDPAPSDVHELGDLFQALAGLGQPDDPALSFPQSKRSF